MNRRTFLKLLSATSACTILPVVPTRLNAAQTGTITKRIPSSGETIPVIGMGTWITFNVGDNQRLRNERTEVLRAFFQHGGGIIDSSPMYGSAEEVVGYGLSKLGYPDGLFSATKVWTPSKKEGIEQVETSLRLWGLKGLDLEQVHNLLSYEEHLQTLFALKESGRLRYVGVTTSHGRRHKELEHVMKVHPLDFVQLTYNLLDREAEKRLLGLAEERGIAVIANRPFRGGSLIDRLQSKRTPLPAWAEEIDCKNWSEFLLKFIVSHPAVTCAIPATSSEAHMNENMGAGRGRLPDGDQRRKMLDYINSI